MKDAGGEVGPVLDLGRVVGREDGLGSSGIVKSGKERVRRRDDSGCGVGPGRRYFIGDDGVRPGDDGAAEGDEQAGEDRERAEGWVKFHGEGVTL